MHALAGCCVTLAHDVMNAGAFAILADHACLIVLRPEPQKRLTAVTEIDLTSQSNKPIITTETE